MQAAQEAGFPRAFGRRPAGLCRSAHGGPTGRRGITRDVTETRRGLAYGVAAYTLWGLAPLFWKLLTAASPLEIISHRVVWGMLTFLALLGGVGAMPALRAAVADPRTVALMALSGGLLVINWGLFVSAVASGRILDSSLGYFINPLLVVALGTLVLRERLRPLQWFAISLAAIGVGIRTWSLGHMPWYSLAIGSSFAGYGLIRKVARVESLVGSTLETAALAPFAAGYLALLALRGGGQLGHAGTGIELLLISTGVITATPLLLFNGATRRLPLSTVGFLQYLSPTMQFVLAVAVYGEGCATDQLIAFAAIWIGLAAFSVDLLRGRGEPARFSRTGR
jgi:chloramphenicol-sensitive protein RarD